MTGASDKTSLSFYLIGKVGGEVTTHYPLVVKKEESFGMERMSNWEYWGGESFGGEKIQREKCAALAVFNP
ncbi:hypothetical protein E2C01_021993 [Portunus trituberculatus]|uniref:Uncharacterized protein n=1 Tax=Portunus trituberculatus TaxID=210409 RepID=A0A5B7E419_PORTR|nr:hypothetical protein [Portunus trituberculatus]